MKKNLAIIPARGGSKRIPKKNIKIFNGKPMIYWSIRTLKKTKLFEKIIVSTDSPRIANIASSFGAEVPFKRPKELSDDFSPTSEVMDHAINFLKNKGEVYENICCVYATNPFLKVNYLKKSFEIFKKSKKKFLFSATEFEYPIQRSFYIRRNNQIKMLDNKNFNKRSQDLEKVYHDAGQFYWSKSNSWKNKPILFSSLSIPFIIPNYEVVDIDNIDDWKRAERMIKYLD